MHRQRAWTASGHYGKSWSRLHVATAVKKAIPSFIESLFIAYLHMIRQMSVSWQSILTKLKIICFVFKQLGFYSIFLGKINVDIAKRPVQHVISINVCTCLTSVACASVRGVCVCVRSESNSITGLSCCHSLRTAWWMWLIYSHNFHMLWKTPAVISLSILSVFTQDLFIHIDLLYLYT